MSAAERDKAITAALVIVAVVIGARVLAGRGGSGGVGPRQRPRAGMRL
jgi:hypothetical protein